MPSNRYWMDPSGLPIVHIFGACSRENTPSARPGYGVDWGPNDPKNTSGSPKEGASKLAAELTAIWVVLKTVLTCHQLNKEKVAVKALEHRIRAVKVCHKSSSLSDELHHLELDAACEKMLIRIRMLEGLVKMQLEQVPANNTLEMKSAMLMARRVSGLHSSADVPFSDEHWEDGTRIVDIFGACNDGAKCPVAGYGVFWKEGDVRNCKDHPPKVQTSYRAYLMALNVALSQVIKDGYDEIIIRSRCPQIHRLIASIRQRQISHLWTGVKNEDLTREINKKLINLKNLIHILPPRPLELKGQQEAQRLAREASAAREGHVSICGLGASNGISRCGLFWGPGHPKNEGGWEDGKHSAFCSEMLALKRALCQTFSKGRTSLTVYTDSDELMCFVKTWREEWKQYGWPTPSGRRVKCMEMCKEVDGMLEKIKLKLRPGFEGDVAAAREFAERVEGPQVVVTVGTCASGNNEPKARYGVFWAPDDSRNESGCIRGEQNAMRAKLIAIRRAMHIAIKHGNTQLILKTDYSPEDGLDKNLMREIKSLKSEFSFIKYRKSNNAELRKLIEKF